MTASPTVGVVKALNKLARQLKSQPVKLKYWLAATNRAAQADPQGGVPARRGVGATGSTSQHRKRTLFVEDLRDGPRFGLGQLTHEVDNFQRPTPTSFSSQHDETSPAATAFVA